MKYIIIDYPLCAWIVDEDNTSILLCEKMACKFRPTQIRFTSQSFPFKKNIGINLPACTLAKELKARKQAPVNNANPSKFSQTLFNRHENIQNVIFGHFLPLSFCPV